MKPIGPLMIEHRLIERIVDLLKRNLVKIKETTQVSYIFIDAAVDFFRTYADRTHHGKEEDILFRELEKKQLSQQHRKIMDELIEEHVYGRKKVSGLVEAKEKYVRGDGNALSDIIASLRDIINFYPAHIEKEDKHFFRPSMDYFRKQEQDKMLQEFWAFDRHLIHEKYKGIVERLEKQGG